MTPFLQRFFNIRRDEVGPILLAAAHFFCILTALMVLRPAREALGMQRGIEAIRWLFMATLALTLLVNPVFGLLVSRFRRLVFIALTHGFFALNLLAFYALLVLTPHAVGVTTGQVFYVWMSVFNLFITMVFWALMADRFVLEQSKRLFGIIAVGGTAGAIAGSSLAAALVGVIGTPALLLVAAAFLALATLAAWGVTRLRTDRADGTAAAAAPAAGAPIRAEATVPTLPAPEDRAIIGGSAWAGMRAVVRSRYLIGISSYVLILAVMVTFVYFTRLQMVAALGEGVDMRAGVFARMDLITQTATLVMQAVIAGHLMKRLGVHVALALAPVVVGIGFLGLAVAGTLTALIVFEATFRAVQRAIMRPARETLFTVVSREDKYKSKAFIDTFVYRGGDAVGAQLEGALGRIGIGLAAVASFAVPLALVWAGLGIWLGLAQRRMAEQPAPPPGPGVAAAVPRLR